MSSLVSVELSSCSPEDTFRIGRQLGEKLPPGAVLALEGDLGSGKTLLTKGLAAGLGVVEHRRVNSPTFVIMQKYIGRCAIHHYDTYRLRGGDDLLSLGFDEDLARGDVVVVVEWADRVAGLIPETALTVRLEAGSEPTSADPISEKAGPARRHLHLSGHAELWGSVLESLSA